MSFTIGFTGTRAGLTKAQHDALSELLKELLHEGASLAIHGDCVGGDADFDQACQQLGLERGIHPCTIENMRAHREKHGATALAEPTHPMARNRVIVKNAQVMIACPPNDTPLKRSGTWATIRFAQKAQKPLHIIYPDGRVQRSLQMDLI